MLKQVVINASDLHRQLGKIIRKSSESGEHVVVQRNGQQVAAMLPFQEYDKLMRERALRHFNQLTRAFGKEAERQGLTEEKLMAELEEDKRAKYEEMYGKSKS